MNTQVRDLYHQIMTAIAETEGQPRANDETWVMQVISITPGVKGMEAVQGTWVEPGQTEVPIRSGVYLTQTFHHRGEKDVAIYNICVMDAAGDIRLLVDTRADSRTPGCRAELRDNLDKLVREHDQLNSQGQTPHQILPHKLNEGIRLMEHRPYELLASWVLYFLEVLDDGQNQHTYEQLLGNVQDAIEARLLTGYW